MGTAHQKEMMKMEKGGRFPPYGKCRFTRWFPRRAWKPDGVFLMNCFYDVRGFLVNLQIKTSPIPRTARKNGSGISEFDEFAYTEK